VRENDVVEASSGAYIPTKESRVMTTIPKRYRARVAAFIAVAAVAACQSSDKLPPKGSTVTVAANPATIPLATAAECGSLLGVTTCGTADIVATIASELGVPLPGQDVRFSSTAGFLYTGSALSPVNAANIPIRTDRFGNANVSLITSTTATVTAKSGAASGTLTINTVSGNLSSILLNIDISTSGCSTKGLSIDSCGQIVCFKATAVDSTGKGIQGVPLVFKLQNNTSSDGKTFNVTFTNSSTTTNTNGDAFAQFTPDNTCSAQCSQSQNGGKSCVGEVVCTTQGGTFQSNTLKLNIGIQ